MFKFNLFFVEGNVFHRDYLTTYYECISTDHPDEDQCSEHQRSADQRLYTSTKICWSIEQNAI
jgi:hypothetical protein